MNRSLLDQLLAAQSQRRAVALVTTLATGEQRLVPREQAASDPLAAVLDQGFEPRAAGIKAIMPYVDEFRPVHSLDSLSDLARALAGPKSEAHDPARWLRLARQA